MDKKKLSKKQAAVIDDLFAGQLEEQEVLEKHKVSRRVYNRWHCDKDFVEHLNLRVATLNRRSELIIAAYTDVAATKLVKLTDSKNPETARKACMDIISLPKQKAKEAQQLNTAKSDTPESKDQDQPLPPATAAKLIAALAKGKE